MTEPVLRIKGLTKAFGGLVAVDRVDYELPGGDLRAIIGPNGAGKTTLFNLISGMLPADTGSIAFRGREITGRSPHAISRMGIARTLQVKSVFNGLSVHDNIWIAAHARGGRLHPLRAAGSYRETASTVESVLEEVGIGDLRDEQAGNLSYGDVALLEMAIALAMRPNLLLLDEPVAGMSPEETQNTVAKIKELSTPARRDPHRARHGGGVRDRRRNHGDEQRRHPLRGEARRDRQGPEGAGSLPRRPGGRGLTRC